MPELKTTLPARKANEAKVSSVVTTDGSAGKLMTTTAVPEGRRR
jgi:hypothetical protein